MARHQNRAQFTVYGVVVLALDTLLGLHPSGCVPGAGGGGSGHMAVINVCSEDDLRRVFGVFGTIQHIHTLREPHTHRSKGCCFLVYSTPQVCATHGGGVRTAFCGGIPIPENRMRQPGLGFHSHRVGGVHPSNLVQDDGHMCSLLARARQ